MFQYVLGVNGVQFVFEEWVSDSACVCLGAGGAGGGVMQARPETIAGAVPSPSVQALSISLCEYLHDVCLCVCVCVCVRVRCD